MEIKRQDLMDFLWLFRTLWRCLRNFIAVENLRSLNATFIFGSSFGCSL